MLAMLAACDSPDPVLTVYPPPYTPPDRLDEDPPDAEQCVHRFLPNGVLEFTAARVPEGAARSRPRPTAACAGGFIFGSSRMPRDVPFDPEVYFTGEEPSLAMRLWTHGFDLFSPNETVIYHYYRREDGTRHWNDYKAGLEMTRLTARRVRALCQAASCPPEEVAALGPYGLGSRRTLAEYEAFSGVTFAGRTIASWARRFPYVRVTEHHTLRLDDSLTPAPDLHLFLLDDEDVLFAAAKGEFYRLNTLSAFTWCALQDGMEWSSIVDTLAERRGIAPDAARGELTELAAHWLGLGILRRDGDEPAPAARVPDPVEPPLDLAPRFDNGFYTFRDHTHRLRGVDAVVRYGDREPEDAVHPVLAHLEVPPPSSPLLAPC